MAHIEDRWMRKARGPDRKVLLDSSGRPALEKDPARYGKGSRWRLRYLNPDGEERNESFGRKVDAERRKIAVEADVQRGTYINPDAGKIIFRKQAEEVMENRVLNPSSRETMRLRMVKHVYPLIGALEIGPLSRRPSVIQNMVKQLEASGLAPKTIETIMAHVSTVFSVAVEDELILKNPVSSPTVVLPKVVHRRLVVWTAEQVFAQQDALMERYQVVVDIGAGLGMRRGEILGFGPDDVDWLRGVASVNRQIKMLDGKPVLALPKGDRTREVPLSESVKFGLAEHMRRFPPITVTLPWQKLDGDPVTVRLFVSNRDGGPVLFSGFTRVWQRGLAGAGIVPKLEEGEVRGARFREHGMHMLRKYFTSVLLAEGESPKAVAEWLGHADGGALLLKVYASILPSSERRMKKTIDAALKRPANQDHSSAGGPQTAQGDQG